MKRNTTVGVLMLLISAIGIPAHGASKETIQLEEEVKLLGTQMTRMQQSSDERLAALKADAEQTASDVKQISAWAQRVDATLKLQTADSDTCADQIGGNSKALREQLEELRNRLDRIAKQLHDMGTPPATAPTASGTSPAANATTPPADATQH
jgi:uncharacterized membrane protein YccC